MFLPSPRLTPITDINDYIMSFLRGDPLEMFLADNMYDRESVLSSTDPIDLHSYVIDACRFGDNSAQDIYDFFGTWVDHGDLFFMALHAIDRKEIFFIVFIIESLRDIELITLLSYALEDAWIPGAIFINDFLRS